MAKKKIKQESQLVHRDKLLNNNIKDILEKTPLKHDDSIVFVYEILTYLSLYVSLV